MYWVQCSTHILLDKLILKLQVKLFSLQNCLQYIVLIFHRFMGLTDFNSPMNMIQQLDSGTFHQILIFKLLVKLFAFKQHQIKILIGQLYLRWIRYLNHFLASSCVSDWPAGIYNVRCRRNVWLLAGISLRSYITTNILTTVPRGLNRVSCIVPFSGTRYPFLPRFICP